MKRRFADDSGVALIFALFAVLILTGLATLLLSDSFSQQQQARGEVDFEGGLHVAESGAESTIARLEEAPEFNTGETWDGVTPEHQWAVAQALAAPASRVVGTADGESVAIRSAGSDNSNFVYGVGFVPSRAAYVAGDKGAVVRVVRMKLAFEPVIYGGDNAILTEANLTMSGNPAKWELTGSHARIHTNGYANIQGRVVEKGVSAVLPSPGGCTYKTSALASNTNCTVAPAPVSVPRVSALAVYNTPDAVALRRSTDEWFDLCPGGVKTGKDGAGNPTTAPCTGVAAAGSFAFSGGATGACGGTWTPTSNSRPAVYYVQCGHVKSTGGGSRTASLVVSAVNGQGGTVDLGGSFVLTGYTSPNALPWKILILADGNVTFHGNPFGAQPFDNPMLVATAGLMDWKGSPTTKNIGFLSSRAKITGGTAGYDVSGGGSGGMEYNGGLNVNLGSVANPSIIDWEELKS